MRQATSVCSRPRSDNKEEPASSRSDNADAVEALAIHHTDQYTTASTLSSVNLGRQPEAAAANAASARSVVSLLLTHVEFGCNVTPKV